LVSTAFGDGLVEAFANSNSFLEAQERMEDLYRIEVWDSSYTQKLREAVVSNSQVRNAFHIPAKVDALIKKWEKKQ
jgi:hypothetical protein